jgi:ribosomal protein S18 acetylase RimI-like enzyme
LKLDTLAHMAGARRLYERLGFAPCSPYYHNPIPGALYMTRIL